MDYAAIVEHFEASARTGTWGALYDPANPASYAFLIRLQKALELLDQPMTNKRVLDLGCGTGVLIPFVLKHGGQYTGVDVSTEMLQSIRTHHAQAVSHGDVTLLHGDLRTIELPDTYDIIVGLGFIEYIDEADAILERLWDRLATGGHLLLSFPNRRSIDALAVRGLAPLRYIARRIFRRSTQQPPRLLWDVTRARQLFLHAGFHNLRLVNYNVNLFGYPFTKLSLPFTNFCAKRFEYSALARWSALATGFLLAADKPHDHHASCNT